MHGNNWINSVLILFSNAEKLKINISGNGSKKFSRSRTIEMLVTIAISISNLTSLPRVHITFDYIHDTYVLHKIANKVKKRDDYDGSRFLLEFLLI